jgi:hypothetical protein
MTLGANTLHPLQIEDAREAAYRASELQKAVEDDLRDAGRELAEAERVYRIKLLTTIKDLHDGLGVGWSSCESMAKGDDDVAKLRKARDDAKFKVEVIQQQAFRRGADRKDVGRLLDWSQARDLRSDAEPPAGQVRTFGARAA